MSASMRWRANEAAERHLAELAIFEPKTRPLERRRKYIVTGPLPPPCTESMLLDDHPSSPITYTS